MRNRVRIGIATILAAVLAATGSPEPPAPPELEAVEMRFWELTDVQNRALEPLAYVLDSAHRELNRRVGLIRYLKEQQRTAQLMPHPGRLPLDVELPLVARDAIPVAAPPDGACQSPCAFVDPRAVQRTRCAPVDPSGRWAALRVAPWSAASQECDKTWPGRNTRTARRAGAIRSELCVIQEQLRELESLTPKGITARSPDELLRCLAELSGVRMLNIAVSAPERVPEFSARSPLRQVPVTAFVEGPPESVQLWLVRVAYLPEIAWTDSVVLRSDPPGSPVVVADARLRFFLWPDP